MPFALQPPTQKTFTHKKKNAIFFHNLYRVISVPGYYWSRAVLCRTGQKKNNDEERISHFFPFKFTSMSPLIT